MGKRLDRAFEVMRERNRRYLEGRKKKEDEQRREPGEPQEPEQREQPEHPAEKPWDELTPEEKAARFHAENPSSGKPGERGEPGEPDRIELEKGDVPAMIIAAILVFGPVFLVLFAILALAWLLLH